jgi:hypothetical protein
MVFFLELDKKITYPNHGGQALVKKARLAYTTPI